MFILSLGNSWTACFDFIFKSLLILIICLHWIICLYLTMPDGFLAKYCIYFKFLNCKWRRSEWNFSLYYFYDPETIIFVRLLVWRNKSGKTQHILKRYKQRINAFSVASYKMVGLVHVRKWEKRNRSSFYWSSWEVVKDSEWSKNAFIMHP